MEPLRLTIRAIPRTKKTGQRILRFGKFNKIVPSKAFIAFQNAVVPPLRRWMGGRAALTVPVLVEAIFWREANRGDLVGFMQAIADILEVAGILENDRLIVGWPMPADGGLPLRKDAARPRIELVISAWPGAVEQLEIEIDTRITTEIT